MCKAPVLVKAAVSAGCGCDPHIQFTQMSPDAYHKSHGLLRQILTRPSPVSSGQAREEGEELSTIPVRLLHCSRSFLAKDP